MKVGVRQEKFKMRWFSKKSHLSKVPAVKPGHVAIIMDGNGRWAQRRSMPRLSGHKAGAETVLRVLGYCKEVGIKYLTLYAFSTENWKRPQDEVSGLMKLLGAFLDKHGAKLIENRVRLRVAGDMGRLPSELADRLRQFEAQTVGFEQQLILALNYSGRSELVNAMRKIAGQIRDGVLNPEDIDEQTISSQTYTPDVPDPDLIIRTSGEFRVSNFLLWQCAYSEFFVTDVLWPDFDEKDFSAALHSYSRRNRRFGGLKEEKKL